MKSMTRNHCKLNLSRNVDRIYQNVSEVNSERNYQAEKRCDGDIHLEKIDVDRIYEDVDNSGAHQYEYSGRRYSEPGNVHRIYQTSNEREVDINHLYENFGNKTRYQSNNTDALYDYVSENDVETSQCRRKDDTNFLQRKTGIETISGSIIIKDDSIKIKTEESLIDKLGTKRQSSLEKLFSHDKWTKERKFLLFSLSVSSGIGCLWRFPSIAYDTGGSFLVCYIIMLVLVGIPLNYMETAISQFSSSGPLKIWRILPILKGITFSQMLASIYLIIYVGYIMSVSIFYIVTSMQLDLPWNNLTIMGCPSDFQNHCNASSWSCNNYNSSSQISAQIYWRLYLLQSDAETFTHFNWKLGFCLLLTWIIVTVSFLKRSILQGKLLFATSTYPFVGILVCFATVLVKDGSKEGLIYGIKPRLEDLGDIKIWYEACVQCFISLGVGFGHVLVYARHNKFRERIPRNCAFTGIYNTCITILSSMLFFSILGTIANSTGIEDIRSLCYKGEHMDIVSPIFIVYSAGFGHIPQIWIILFFVILFLSALSNMMIYIEFVSSALSQQCQVLQQSAAFCISLLCCMCGLLLTTNVGPMIVNSLDSFGVSITVFVCSIIQLMGIFWIYGYKCFFRDVDFMSKSETNVLVKVFYASILPVGLTVVCIFGVINFAYNKDQTWVTILGWVLAGVALVQLPIWFAVEYFQAPEWGWKNKLKYICKPEQDWGPVDPLHYREWLHEKTESKYSFDKAKAIFFNPALENEYTL